MPPSQPSPGDRRKGETCDSHDAGYFGSVIVRVLTDRQIMTGFLLRGALAALGLWLATYVFSGLSFDEPATLIAAALLLGIVNAVIRPLVLLLTLPLTVVTLGLFLLVIN